MLLALLGVAAGPALPSDPVAINPTSWFSAFSYPPEAEKRKIEDEVHFEVDVDAGGNPTACRITFSSGSPYLDQPTCAIIMAKAHFQPARDSSGLAVAGHYRNSTVWQLRLGHGPRWAAAILDLSDPKHPRCTDSAQGGPVMSMNCSYLLHNSVLRAELAKTMEQVVYFSSMTFDGNKPYSGDPQWGQRVSFSAMDGYYLKHKSDCVVVAAEGLNAVKGLNLKKPCSAATFYRQGGIPASMRDRADKVRLETSIFVIPRKGQRQNSVAR